MPGQDLIEALHQENIFTDIQAADKEALLDEISRRVADRHPQFEARMIQKKLIDREGVMSTGIGHRVAVPHVSLENLEQSHIFLFVLGQDIDFQAIDGRPVRIVFLLLVRPDDIAFHLQGLSTLARLARNPGLADDLCNAAGPGEILARLQVSEASSPAG